MLDVVAIIRATLNHPLNLSFSIIIVAIISITPLIIIVAIIFFFFYKRKFLDNIQQFATKMVSTCNLTKQAYLYTIKRTIEN